MTLLSLSLGSVAPEIILAFVACVVLLADLYLPLALKARVSFLLCVGGLLAAIVACVDGYDLSSEFAMNGLVVDDGIGDVMKTAVCGLVLLTFCYSRRYAADRELLRSEYLVLGLFGTVGMMVMVSAAHLITLYVGLELLSLCLYGMVAFRRDALPATEAAMKFFILGALASGVLLYGMSLLYGLTGSLQISEVRAAITELPSTDKTLAVAVVLVIAGLMFKIGAVPFHMWVPDVYEGAPTSTTIYLASAPKVAGFAIIFRLLIETMGDVGVLWQDILILVALLSIGLGNVVAIAQQNIKRMLAYSGISHMGFFLLGILSGTADGYAASLAYILIYALITVATFAVVLSLSGPNREAERLNDYKGLGRVHPWLAFLMLLLMVSLAGFPPTLGFFAKLVVLQAVIDVGLVWVAVGAVLFAVIGAFYYLRIVKLMYFDAPADNSPILNVDKAVPVILSVNALAMVLVMPWLGLLADLCQDVVRSAVG